MHLGTSVDFQLGVRCEGYPAIIYLVFVFPDQFFENFPF